MVETRSKKRQYVNDCEELVLTKKRKINPIEESPENDKLIERTKYETKGLLNDTTYKLTSLGKETLKKTLRR